MKFFFRLLLSSFFLSGLLLLSIQGQAQHEAKTWYFGNGYALKFGKGPAEMVPGGPGDVSTTYTYANQAGQVIVYANLRGIFNKDRTLVENGTWGLRNLGFDMYILPKPGTSAQYYIFYTIETLDEDLGWAERQAIAYAVVDLAANNGAGKVLEKDRIIYQNTHGYFTVSGNCGNNTYWLVGEANTNILSHIGTDQLFAFKITEQGIAKEPVRSEPVLIGNAKFLKFSPAGDKLTFSYRGYESIEGLGLASFNTQTGEVSKSIRLGEADWKAVFSPSGKKLYLNHHNTDIKEVWQYDISQFNEQYILASRKLAYDGPVSLDLGQPAPDGSMYYSQVDNPKALAVIRYPEREGAASGVLPNAINFPLRFVRNLPTFPVNFLYVITPHLDAGPDREVQAGQPVVLGGAHDSRLSYFWEPAAYLSDPASPTPTFAYTGTKKARQELTYRLHVRDGNCVQTDEATITVLPEYEEITQKHIPNIFTPNGDQLNDFFAIPILEQYPENELVVLNRLGNEVYRKKGYQGTWNGDNVTAGIYYYQLYINTLDKYFRGWVEIIK